MPSKRSGLDRINAAAVRVIGRRGFADATTQEIAKAARVSEGLIFRYYATKEKLGLELFSRHHQEVLALLREQALRHNDPVERLEALAMAFFRWFDENPDVARFLLRTHGEFLEKVEDGQGLMQLASAGLRDVLGDPLFLLFPNDILTAMGLGSVLQVAVECVHGQITGPLAPRMEPILRIVAENIRRVLPASSSKTGGAEPGPAK
jgi:AcrR family transcriptional regulator